MAVTCSFDLSRIFRLGGRTPAGVPVQLLAAAAVAVPGAYLGAASYVGLPTLGLGAYAHVFVFGAAIVGAAFLLAWAADAAQVDVSAGLALAILALVAVLPEYAVDFVFSFRAGRTFAEHGQCVPPGAGGGEPNPCALALANMTGANRVLVGIGWPLVVVVASVAAYRHRRAARESASVLEPGLVRLTPPMAVEVTFLGVATLYSLTLPLKETLTLWDAAVLAGIFVVYAWRLAQAPAGDPDLIGTAAWIADRERRRRRLTVAALFATAGVFILVTAEHFADALVETGSAIGIREFVLVQWVAPIASESPELMVASIYAWRLKASHSLGTLLSSKVNQWTLLVGTIPIVFALSSLGLQGLPLDENQRFELLLTAAQSLFAVALLIDLRLSLWGAAALATLFSSQFVASIVAGPAVNRAIIVVLTGIYVASAVGVLARRYRRTAQLARDGTVTPLDELDERREELEREAASRASG